MLIEVNCAKHGVTEGYLCSTGTKRRCKKCNNEAVTRRRRKVKELAVEYKGGKCCRCGYDKCIAALDFHHLDPTQKDFAIGSKGETRSFERVKEELDKCILLCANCHREEHHRLKQE